MIDLPAELVAFEDRLIEAAHRNVKRWRYRRVAVALSIAALCAAGSAVAGGRALGISALDGASTPPAPPSIDAALRTLGMPAPGVELPATIPVNAHSLGQGIYAAERDGTLCVWIVNGAGQCGRTFTHSIVLTGDEIRARDSETSPLQVEFAGVARDGVSAVQVTTTMPKTLTMPVTANAFRGVLLDATFADIRGVSIIHADGSIEHATPSEFGFEATALMPPEVVPEHRG